MLRPGEDTFSEADLEPSAEERRIERRTTLERAAAAVAVMAAGVWAGGLLALGACAAPFVFQLTPYPHSGEAMGSAFARFDGIAIGCSAVMLACEVARTFLDGRRMRSRFRAIASRVRRFVTILMGMMAVYGGLVLTPAIRDLHHAGARRGIGEQGELLEKIHKRAELVGKSIMPLALLVIGLHLFTLRRARDEEDELVEPPPVPPGPPEEE